MPLDRRINTHQGTSVTIGEAEFWDNAATTYDSLARHGIRTPSEREAWTDLLNDVLGKTQSRVLDVGTGTGSVAILAGVLGHDVVAVDTSDAMLAAARSKAAPLGLKIEFRKDDLNSLMTVSDMEFDAVISRHVLWTLRCPASTIGVWRSRVRLGGQVVAVDGCWFVSGWRNQARGLLGRLLSRLERGPREHGASYYDQLDPADLPFRRLDGYEPVCQVFREVGLEGVAGRWLSSVDAVERSEMRLSERLSERGRRFIVSGTRSAE